VGVLFTALFSFLIFYVPLVFGVIGPTMFVLSGVMSLCVISTLLWLQSYLTPEVLREHLTIIARSIAVIFIAFNVLYFSNAIPPLPLALKESAIFHSFERKGDEYRALAEKAPWYQPYLLAPAVFHRAGDEPVYAFSAVFAPSKLTTTIYHEWQYYDTERAAWETVSTVGFPITGGREGGYRGFSRMDAAIAGKWRVDVKTEHGQIIGRITFTIVDVSEPVTLEQTVR
jgi:hypothetical protein